VTTEARPESDSAREFLEGILSRMKIDAVVDVAEKDDKIVLEIRCEADDDTQRIIGRRGQVVDALQHVVGKIVSKSRVERGKPVVVDAGGYRQRHIERLEDLAERMAEKCREQGRAVDLSPMSAYDRRIIHMAIARLEGVETESEGEGEERHVVVLPAPAE